MPRESTTLKVGDQAPTFRLRTPSGEAHAFEGPRARPLVVVFIRGTW